MKRTVMGLVMAAVGTASLALAPSAFASDRHGHRIPLPHEVLGIPLPHEVILGALSHNNRDYDGGNYRVERRYDNRHNNYDRRDYRGRGRGYNGRYDRDDRRHDRHHHDRRDRHRH